MATIPSVTTVGVDGISAHGAQGEGNITNTGGATVTVRGICWIESPSGTPTVGDETAHQTGSFGTGSYLVTLSGITEATIVRYRAYAVNTAGTGYGSTLQFKTLALPPTVYALAATNITGTAARLNGEVHDDGGEACEYRFEYYISGGTHYYTTWTGAKTTGQTFYEDVGSLEVGKYYYVKAQIRNTDYDDEDSNSFNTLDYPDAATYAATNILSTSARLNGKVVDDEEFVCQYRFRCKKSGGSYSYSTWTGSKTTGQTFYEDVGSLSKYSLYYFNAQVKNVTGESDWGSEKSFTTLATIPNVSTQACTNVDYNSALGNGYITDIGGQCTRRGFCYKVGTTGDPTTSNSTAYDDGSFGTGAYSKSITGLSPGTNYRVRAYAVNSAGTGYGTTVQITTNPAPTVTTQAVTAIEEETATGNGNVTDTGGETVTKRGICWNTTGSPTIANSKSEETGSFGTGSFNRSMTGLSPGIKYYVKAYAYSVAGYGYGSEVNFVTKPNPPTLLNCIFTTETQIDVTWTKGSGAEKTMVRRKEGSYPTSVSDGDEAYFDTSNSFNDTSMDAKDYYYRAWSFKTDAPGSGYSDEYDSDIAEFGVSVTTYAPTDFLRADPSKVTANGLISLPLGGTITTRGFKYGLTETDSWNESEEGSYSEGAFSLQITGLNPDTTYYIRAYATGAWGTKYGSYLEFKTEFPYGANEVKITSEATASDADIAKVGGKRTLKIENHLIQNQTIADIVSAAYLADYKDQKTKLVVTRPSPAPYEIGDTITVKKIL